MAHRAILEVEPEWAEEESGWRSAEEILMAGRLVTSNVQVTVQKMFRLPGQKVATVEGDQLPESSVISQQKVFSILLCHPVASPLTMPDSSSA